MPFRLQCLLGHLDHRAVLVEGEHGQRAIGVTDPLQTAVVCPGSIPCPEARSRSGVAGWWQSPSEDTPFGKTQGRRARTRSSRILTAPSSRNANARPSCQGQGSIVAGEDSFAKEGRSSGGSAQSTGFTSQTQTAQDRCSQTPVKSDNHCVGWKTEPAKGSGRGRPRTRSDTIGPETRRDSRSSPRMDLRPSPTGPGGQGPDPLP